MDLEGARCPDLEARANLVGDDLRFGELVCRLSKDGLRCGDRLIRLSDVREARVEPGINVSRLVVVRSDGSEEELAYFTRDREEGFRRLAEAVNLCSRGVEPPAEQGAKGKEGGTAKRSTLLWLYSFARPYRRRLALGTALALATTALSLVPPYMLKVLIDGVLESPGHPMGLFEFVIGVLAATYAALAVLNMFQGYVLNSTGSAIINELRYRLYRHVMGLDASFIDRVTPSRILSRLTTDAGNTNWLLVWGLPTVLTNIFTIIGIGAIMFSLNVRLAAIIVAPAPVIVLMIRSYRSRAHRLYHRNWRNSADVTAFINDTVPNYSIIKSLNKDEEVSAGLADALRRLYRSSADIALMNATYWPLLGLLLNSAAVAVWFVGGREVIAGFVQLGVLVAFVTYATQFYGPISNLSNVLPFVQQSLTSADRLREVFEARPSVVERGHERPDLKGDIVFERVTFGYDPLVPVVRDVSLRIPGGSRVAVVGRTGSGKSTVVKLLMRLYDPTEGRITVGGVDLRDVDLRYLRSKLAYVPQEVTLFYDTIANNIAFGADTSVGPREIIEAAKLAMIHDEIVQMPLAYDTIAGERGTSLSGGQRQRVGIARALVRRPDIVVLDEATSNLDVESEAKVYAAIAALTRGRTTIIITHQPREILTADLVVVMEDGRVVEQGPPRDLMARGDSRLRRMLSSYVGPLEPPEAPDVQMNFVDCERCVRVRRSSSGRRTLVDVYYNGHVIRGATVKHLFPISRPEVVAVLRDGKEEMIILDYRRSLADEESVETLERALNASLLRVNIRAIRDIDPVGDGVRWSLVTERGTASVLTVRRKDVLFVDGRLVLLADNGVLYEARLSELDRRSLRLISMAIA